MPCTDLPRLDKGCVLDRPQGVRCVAPDFAGPQITYMANDARLEVRIPAQQRQELVRLAQDTGLTVPGLVRLATQRLLDDRTSLLRGSSVEDDRAA
jgi:hypothetical protein